MPNNPHNPHKTNLLNGAFPQPRLMVASSRLSPPGAASKTDAREATAVWHSFAPGRLLWFGLGFFTASALAAAATAALLGAF